MKALLAFLIVVLVLFGGFTVTRAEDLKDKVRVEIESVGLHPGMDPGVYVCALGHLHIKGKVQNVSDVTLGQIKVGGKAFDSAGKLLGTAATSTKEENLAPNTKAEMNLEFLTVVGSTIQQVKRHEVTVTAASPKQ